MADLFDRFESEGYGQGGGSRQQQQSSGIANPFDDMDLTAIQSVSATSRLCRVVM